MASLTAADFTPYNTADAGSIEAGPLALFTVPVASIMPTQQNEGFTEVDAKAAGYDQFTTLAEVENDLLGDVEPVVIGPNGQLYLLDGHHTFTALLDSVWGAQNPTVYVNVIANFSGLSQSEFLATMQSDEFLLPLNDGVPEPVSDLPTSLTGLTSDVYRGLEYSILKNKSSKLFTNTNNITGATGASTPGLDKMPGLYSDFFEAAAYQDADGGNGLPYLSPGDIALATRWNLNPDSATTLPNVSGTVFASQLPGFILSQNVVINGVVSNATMNESGTTGMSLVAAGESQTGALDGSGNGTFTGVTEINAGTLANPIWIGTPNTGFIMQLGNDKGFTATLSNTANTYVGGTTILAGRLIIASDGSLGAAPTETLAQFNNSLTFDTEGMLDNAGPAVQADNGIIFNSLSEGNGTLTIGTSADQYPSSSPFVTNRPIAVGNEAATIDVNGSTVDLDGPLVTLGYDELGIGETTGFPDLTIDDLSSGGGSTPTAGKLVLSIPSPDFYGDIIIGNTGTPTVEVMSDAALGNTTPIDGSTIPIGTVELNGGTLQTGASFAASERNITLDGGSQIDLDGNTTSWGTLTDVKRTIAIGNSNTTTAGAITFNNFVISQTAQLQLDGSADGTTYSGNETVAFTNGIQQTAPSDTLFIDPSSATALGTATEKLFSSGASTTLVNGMAPAWIITDSGGGASTNPYNFVTYGANGYVNVTYTDTGSGSMGGIRTATSTSIVDQTGNATLAANAAAYALKVNDGAVITATGFTITIGDGTAADAAGLILGGGSAAITGGTLAFGGSQGIIYVKGTTTVTSEITGTNGLTIAGSGTLQLNSAAPLTGLSGAITIDSGELSLGTANLFQSDVAGLTLDDVKSHPSNSILNFTASQTFTTLNSVGTKSAITFSDGATLTIGDTTNNLSSTLSSSITESGVATAGALTINGTGLTDLSGMSGGTLSLVSGSTIVVENGAQLRVTASEFANGNFGISLGNGTQLQFAQNGGGQFANAITGSGELHLIGGTLQLTETAGANTYTGGTVVETGSTLDLTTSQVSTGNANITDAGGLIVFDQDFGGTYAGIISDGKEMGTGPMLSGSLDIDDSAADSASDNNVTLTAVQGYSGATYVEAGTLTLGVANAIADSSGVTLGRVGGAVSGIVGGASSGPTYTQTANLVLEANQQLKSLSSDAGNATTVTLNGNTLTLTPGSGIDSNYSGVIADGSGSGSVVADGAGTVTFGGDNTFSGGVTIDEGVFELANAGAAGTGAITFAANADATLKIDLGDEPTGAGNTVDGFKIGDSIDFAGVGLETGYTYSGGVLTLTGGSSSAQIDLAAPPSGQFFVLSSDGSGGTVVTLDSTVPTESVGGPYTGNEGVAIPLNLSVTATPNTGDSLSTTVSAGDGTITVGTTGGASISNNGSGSVTLAGTAAQINTALGNASYTGDSGFYGSDTLSMTATDTTDGQSSPTDTVGITVNDTTAPGESLHGPYSGNENTPIALNLSVSASPTVTDPLSTTLSVSNGIVSADGQTGSSITLTGTAAQIDTALQAASYTGNSNFYGSDTLSMTTTDTADNQTTGAETAGITVNDTATIADTGVTGGFSGNENTAISLASVHISDSNTGDTSLVTTLSVSDGTITVGTTAGGAAVGTNGTGTVTLTGTAAQIDASLQNSSYTGDSNFYGNDTLSVTSTDGGSQTSGPSQGRITVNDTTVPTESVGGPYGGNENTAIALNLSVSASPNTSDPLSTTLSVLNGTVSADGQTGSSITLTGTAAQINTALGGASYTGNTNFYGNDTLSMTTTDTEDNQSTGAEAAGVTVADTATISETGVTGGFSGNENTAISLASVQVSDTNTNDNTLVTTLSVNDGTVSVGTTAGGAAVGNNGTGTVTLSGTTAEIDASLKNTSYTGNSNFHGQDMLSVTSTDHGGRISGTSTGTITVANTTTVSEHVGGPYGGNENTAIALNLSVSASPNTNDPLSATLSVGDGTVTAGGQTGSSITLTGTAQQINTALQSASYTGNSNFYGSDTLSMTTTDTADHQTTGAETASIAVADTATITETVPGSLSGVWGTPISLAGIMVADIPNTGDTLTTLLKVSSGTITVSSGSGATVSGSGTGTVTLVGTQAAIDAALQSADYSANASSAGADTLSVTTTDPDGHSSGTKTVPILSNLPSSPDLGLGLGAGPAGSLNETNAPNTVFTGVAQPFSLILLYDGSTLEGAGLSNAQGQWTAVTLAPLPAGNQQITATAYNLNGHSETSAATTVDVTKGTTFGSATTTQNVNFQAGDGNNTMQWANGVGVVIAGDGDNKITAGNGKDVVQLGDGNNVVSLGNGNDSVTAGNGSNTVTVGNGNDAISVGSGHNQLVLGNGDDTISLGGGGDTVTLGTGMYAITTQPFGSNGSDTIILMAPPAQLSLAFNTGDRLVFANTGFDLGVDDGKGSSTPQQIAASLFSTSTNGTFTNANQRFAYNQSTGNLYYDAQGNKAGSAVQLVGHLTNDPHLTASNLYFIS